MNALEGSWGRPLKFNSRYRDADKNTAVGGAKNSQHLTGSAFDVDTSDYSEKDRQALIKMARETGFGGVGVYDNSLHFDTGEQRDWGSSYKSASTPEWAKASLGRDQEEMSHGSNADRRQIDPQVWAQMQAGLPPQQAVGGGASMMPGAVQGEVLGTAGPSFTGGGTARAVGGTPQQGPGAPGPSDVANFRSQAELALSSASGNNRGNIPSGLAHVLDRGVAAYSTYRANKAEKERSTALAEALGGVGADGAGISDDQISSISALDPDMGRALMSSRMQSQAASRSAAAAKAAKQADRDWKATEAQLDRDSKERIGADKVSVTVSGDQIDADKPKKGYHRITEYDDQGRVAGVREEPIPGGAVDREHRGKARKSKNTLFSLEQQWKGVDSRINDAMNMITSGIIPVTGLWSLANAIPGTPQYTMRTHLETIRANIGFDKLQDMRSNSPTGGALGQVSEMENRLLQATRGSTDQALAGEQLMTNLKQIQQDLAALQIERREAYQQDWGHYEINKEDEDGLPDGWTIEGG
jgi:hypothetical protein